MQSIDAYRLPVISDVTLTDCIKSRTQIGKLLTATHTSRTSGAPSASRTCSASGDEKTEKMRYAEKFNARGEASIWMDLGGVVLGRARLWQQIRRGKVSRRITKA